jgi:NTP pyrophosphatase (non-canonical NTP hydrolase)
MDRTHLYRDIDAERDRQDARFGRQIHSWPVWSAVLAEECGEVAQACLQAQWQEPGGLEHLREELIQVAAVAVHMLEKLDAGEYIAGDERITGDAAEGS